MLDPERSTRVFYVLVTVLLLLSVPYSEAGTPADRNCQAGMDCHSQLGQPNPPIWPNTFSVEFVEQLNSTSPPYSTQNTGRWFYDWSGRQSRFDHDRGHRNDFCVLSGLAGASHSSCRLYFSSDEQMWVALPERKLCCSLCKPNPHGFPGTCSTLLPNWLQNSTYKGTVRVGANQCNWFSKPGAVAIDNWYATPDGKPCEYREHYVHPGSNIDNITDHHIMYDRASYNTSQIPSSIFKLPEYCSANCIFPAPLLAQHFPVLL